MGWDGVEMDGCFCLIAVVVVVVVVVVVGTCVYNMCM